MDGGDRRATTALHVVAMPYPGRGHINPMMNLCKSLVSTQPHILVTFVVTDEWLDLLSSDRTDPMPENIRFATVANVIPSERVRAADYPGFYEAVMIKMEAPVERLLDRIEPPVAAIIADVELLWGTRVANRRNIPVAGLWTASGSMFSMFHHFKLAEQNRASSVFVNLSGDGGQSVTKISGISLPESADLRAIFQENDQRVMQLCLECVSCVPKAQYLLLTGAYELEPQVIDKLRANFPFTIYPLGPTIPYMDLKGELTNHLEDGSVHETLTVDYLQWLDLQSVESVLYISLGSFLSVSTAQMDEIATGLRKSGIRFLWVARTEADRLRDSCGDKGLVISWCQQLKVLCHSSVGGFWTHCGWNSTMEGVFSGVPMLTQPLSFDQFSNNRKIVEEWKIGWKVGRTDNLDLNFLQPEICRIKEQVKGSEKMVTSGEIARIVQRFMDLEDIEGKAMRRRCKELGHICGQAIENGGSSRNNLEAFIRNISQAYNNTFY